MQRFLSIFSSLYFARFAIYLPLLSVLGLSACRGPQSSVKIRSHCGLGTEVQCNAFSKGLEVAGNPAYVELNNPNGDVYITLTDPAFANLQLSIPKGSYVDKLNLVVERRDLNQNETNRLYRLYGWIVGLFVDQGNGDETEVIHLMGDQPLLEKAKILLPLDWTSPLSTEEKEVMRVRVYSSVASEASVIIPHEELIMTTVDESIRYSFSFQDWGAYAVEADILPPVLSLKASIASPTGDDLIAVLIEASEPLESFATDQIDVTNGAITDISKSNLIYTIQIAPTADGVVNLSVVKGAVRDLFGNPNEAAFSASFTSDRTRPNVLITSTDPSTITSYPTPVLVTFSESVTGFSINDLSLMNATASSFSGSGTTYTFDLTPSSQGVFSVEIAGDSAADSSGNGNSTSNLLSRTYTNIAPTLSITEPTGNDDAEYIGFSFNITFSVADPDNVATIELYYREGSSAGCSTGLTGWTLITGSLSEGTHSNYSWDTTGLSAGTYYICATISDGVNPVVYGSVSGALTVNTYNLSAPSALSAGSPTDTAIDLSWTDNSTSEAGFKVERSTSSGSGFTQVHVTAANATTYTDTNLTPETTYYYRVRAYYSTDDSAYTAEASSTTLLQAPTNFSASTADTQVILEWTPVAGASTYNLYWSTTQGLGKGATKISSVTSPYTHTGRTNGTTYYYTIAGENVGGEGAISLEVFSTPPDNVITSNSMIATGNSNQKKMIHDSANDRHWAFTYSGSNIQYAYSINSTTWTNVGSLAYNTHDFAISFKNISGTSYVYLVATDDYDIVLRRGTLSPTNITWDSAVTVYDGASDSNLYLRPYITLSANNYVWVGGAHYDGDAHQGYAKRSSNVGSESLSTWEAATSLGLHSASAHQVMLTPKSGGEMYALINHGGSVIGYSWDESTWTENTPSGEGDGWFQLGGGNGPLGNDNFVNSLVVYNGDIVIGGRLYNFGGSGQEVNYIAKWDGSSWSSLGSGTNYDVNVRAIMGGELYVGGGFNNAGGVATIGVAKWNGTSWSALGSGMNGVVRALAVHGTNLYVAGGFSTAGGVSANNVAKWDGTTWSALGSGVNGSIEDLIAMGSDIYVGGWFTTAGGSPASKIAKWNGTSWSALGSGCTATVSSLAVMGTDLYAAGAFNFAGGVSANRIAKWNGTSWSALGTGLDSINSGVKKIVVLGSDLYVGGQFTSAGGSSANNIAKWNGSTWSSLGSGLDAAVYALSVMGSDLYVGGWFMTAGGASANKVAKWNGTTWSALTPGVPKTVRAIAVMGSDLYVGGIFTSTGGIPANNIAKWDGTNWEALGSGVNGTVSSLAVIGTDLYAGGEFTTAGGSSANYVAKWNGTTWEALGSGVGSALNALAVMGSDLYAGGAFTTAGGAPANRIARWDTLTGQWSALSSGLNSSVFALGVYGSELYVGGWFTTAGGVSASRVAKWDGTNWYALGTGVSDTVRAFAVMGSDLFVGGDFTTAGGQTANGLAKWDGASWSGITNNNNNYSFVYYLAVLGSALYVGGYFQVTGEAYPHRVARWQSSDSSWNPVSPEQLPQNVQALHSYEGKLYAGLTANLLAVYRPVVFAGVSSISVAGSGSNLHISVHEALTGKIKHRRYDGTTWSSTTELTTGASRDPQLSVRSSNGHVYLKYVESGALKYRMYNTSAWSAASTLYTGTGITKLTCPEVITGTVLPCLWTNPFSVAPYNILVNALGL